MTLGRSDGIDPGCTGRDDPLRRLDIAVSRIAEANRVRRTTGRSHQDADDTVGTIDTDDAIGFDPRPMLRALHTAGVTVAVIGQVAGILHGSAELTGDLDLLWDGNPNSATAMAAAFRSVPATVCDDDGAETALDAAAFRLPKVLFSSASASGDCCTPALPWGELPVAEFLARSEQAVGADGLVVHYLNRVDLIRMRRAVGRPKDVRRADELERLVADLMAAEDS